MEAAVDGDAARVCQRSEMTAGMRRLELVREQQRLAALSLTFSVTRRCPLSCAHCSQDSGPKVSSRIMGPSFAHKVVAELPELRRAGLEYVGFTGGEPTLAIDFVRRVSDACTPLGIKTGILSAANWATSDGATARMLDRLPGISCWDLSTDRYHLEQVPLANLERAFRLLSARGKPALVRFAYHLTPGAGQRAGEPAFEDDDAELVRRIRAFAGDRIAFQPVEARGRGHSLAQLRRPGRCASSLLCMSDGLLVDEEGRISPCASLLASERFEHPLLLGDANRVSLVEALRRWRTHPLLQLLRLGSLTELMDYFRLSGGSPITLRGDADCERCVGLMKDDALVRRLLELLEQPETRAALAGAVQTALGESWMLAATPRPGSDLSKTHSHEGVGS
jgi:hypothetical protein